MASAAPFARQLLWSLALGASASACACGQTAASSGSVDVPAIIQVDGSSSVFPISEAVAEEFRGARPDVRVTVGVSGTGGGFQKFCRAETDLSDASRPIQRAEIEACHQSGVEYIELPVAYDGVAVVVNPRNDWTESVTVDELRRLW